MPKTKKQLKGKSRRRSKRRQAKINRICLILFAFVLTVGTILGVSRILTESAVIHIEAKSVEIYQDSEVPQFETFITVEGNTEIILDKTNNYSVASLVEDLEEGIALSVNCVVLENYAEGEDILEGEYIIDAYLTEEYLEKVSHEWKKKVKVEIDDGNLAVKNKIGYWEEEYIDPDQPMIALTFDDGPGDYTMELLEALEEYDVHATFFMQGYNIHEDDKETIQKMLDIGCEIGNHSTTHADFTTLNVSQIQSEINQTNEEIFDLVGVYPTVMRPPYGAVNDTVKSTVGLPIILWNVDTLDWKTNDANDVVEHILTVAGDGDIVLMHDTKEWSVEATIEVIPILLEQGYQLVTVSEMAEAHGVTMVSGGRYFFFD